MHLGLQMGPPPLAHLGPTPATKQKPLGGVRGCGNQPQRLSKEGASLYNRECEKAGLRLRA